MKTVPVKKIPTRVLITIRDKSVLEIKVFLKDQFWFSLARESGGFLYTDHAGRPNKISAIDEINDREILESPWPEKIQQAFESELQTVTDLRLIFSTSRVCMANEPTPAETAQEYFPPHVQRELNPENS